MVTYSNARRIHRYPKSSSIHIPWRNYMLNYDHSFSNIMIDEWQDIEPQPKEALEGKA